MRHKIKGFNQLVPVAAENYFCGDIFEAAHGGRPWCRSLIDQSSRTPLASDIKVLLKVTKVESEIRAIIRQGKSKKCHLLRLRNLACASRFFADVFFSRQNEGHLQT